MDDPMLDSQHGQGTYLVSKTYRTALGSTQAPTKLVPGVLSPGGKTIGA
jgi:hypothetical protein